MVHLFLKENSSQALAFLEYARTLPFVEIRTDDENETRLTKDQFLSKFEESLKQVKENKTISINELFDGE